MVYLVPDGTAREIDQIREASLDSVVAGQGIPVLIDITSLSNGTYLVYATDTALNISDPASLVVLGVGIEPHLIGSVKVYPNPFTSSTTLGFYLQRDGQMMLSVYDSQGKQVRIESLGYFGSGQHFLSVERGEMESGVYLFRLENDEGIGYSGRWTIR
jgi:hypothetical protein